MTLDFQVALLQSLYQQRELKRYVKDLPAKTFTKPLHQAAMELLKDYVARYKVLPSQVGALELLAEQLEGDKAVEESYHKLKEIIPQLFLVPQVPLEQVQSHLDGEVTRSLAGLEVAEFLRKLREAEPHEVADLTLSCKAKLGALVQGRGENGIFINEGGLLTDAHTKLDNDPTIVYATPWHGLNQMTSLGGFYTPQLIIFAAAPKSFKTGVMLNLALGFVKQGLKVYYADAENGEKSILRRSMQHFLEAKAVDVYNDPYKFAPMAALIRKFAPTGNMWVDSYPTFRASMGDVEERLAELKEVHGFVPNVIIYDSIDHFIPTNSYDRNKKEYEKIGIVYFEAINLNKRYGYFAIAPSQVTKEAVGKESFKMSDLGGSFAKVANCHASFAICQTPEEEMAGLARIEPIVQREGKSHVTSKGGGYGCILRMEKDIMQIKETTVEEI